MLCHDADHADLCEIQRDLLCRREAATSSALVSAQEKEMWAAAKEKEACERMEKSRLQEEQLRMELCKTESAQEAARIES
jgi:hypothetical protein